MMSSEKSNHSSRQLSAILFADVVGYTALMQKDESAATVQLRRFQNEMEKIVAEYNGRIVNFYGDGALCTFKSPLEAMPCAIELQSGFQTSPILPVRIGIHSGTVVTEGDKVFGDSVNVASRIESMGIPGAILVSKKVRDELKNQPDILLPSLGQFEFKNVEEPIEVYALANEGFAIPRKEEIQGKFKTKPETKRKWLWPLSFLIIAIAALGIWKFNAPAGLELSEHINIEPGITVPNDVKDKRVAVMVFENLTMNPSMDAFGKMTSDWITKGLMETRKVNIISGANIQSKIQLAGAGLSNVEKFAEATGVGVILEGRYYIQEGNLIIHTNIIDAEKGEVIHALDPISGPKENMLNLLEQLTQDVMGYWAVEKIERYLQNPPKYEAYKVLMQAELHFYTDPEECERLLLKAFTLDSTFYIPMLKLLPLYGNIGNRDQYAHVLSFLETKKSNFTEWEKLRYEAQTARFDCDFAQAADYAKRRFEMDPSDIIATNNAAENHLMRNDPYQALSILNDVDLRLRDMDILASNREFFIACSHYILGEYEKAIKVIDSYPFEKIRSTYANLYLGSIIRKGELDKIDIVKEEFLKRDCFTNRGEMITNGDLLLVICNILASIGQDSLLETYASQLENWAMSNKTHSNFEDLLTMSQYYQGDYNKALIQSLNIDSQLFMPEYLGFKGICYAKMKNREKAEMEIERIKDLEENRPVTLGRKYYNMASILVALGDSDKAMDLLIQAPENCFPYNKV